MKTEPATLREGDISSERVSRRSLLTTLGIGVGVAAAAVVVGTTGAAAYSDRAGFGRCRWGRTRTDPYDTGRYADPRRVRIRRRCTDSD